jgi:hypothetical protein
MAGRNGGSASRNPPCEEIRARGRLHVRGSMLGVRAAARRREGACRYLLPPDSAARDALRMLRIA